MPQTKFVLGKALRLGLRPIVVINKVDRPTRAPTEVLNEVFDLFAALDADEQQLDFPTLFAPAKQGWARAWKTNAPTWRRCSISSCAMCRRRSSTRTGLPHAGDDAEANPYLGRMLTGRIESGVSRAQHAVKALSRDGSEIEQGRSPRSLAFRGLERQPVEEAEAGDIVAIAGLRRRPSPTRSRSGRRGAAPAQPIDPPTIAMTFSVNDRPARRPEAPRSPRGRSATGWMREAEGNVAIRVPRPTQATPSRSPAAASCSSRADRDHAPRGLRDAASAGPACLFRNDPGPGERLEPIEEVVVDVDEAFAASCRAS